MLRSSGTRMPMDPQRERALEPAWEVTDQRAVTIPWFTPEGYGILEYDEKALRMRCVQGILSLGAVRLPRYMEAAGIVSAGQNGAFTRKGDRVYPEKEIRIGQGEMLEILRSETRCGGERL